MVQTFSVGTGHLTIICSTEMYGWKQLGVAQTGEIKGKTNGVVGW